MRSHLYLLLRISALPLICAFILFPMHRTLRADSHPRFAQIAPAGATQSWACDINDKGQIVGYFVAKDGRIRGFLLDGGRYTSISGPKGAVITWAFGLNNRGDIVGSYLLRGDSQSPHGFLLRAGQYLPIAGPAWEKSFLSASSINDRGEITGLYVGRDGHPHRYVLTNGLYRAVDSGAQGETTLFHPGIARISTNASREQGFFHRSTSVLKAQDIQVSAVNDRGEVAGSYTDGKAITHGFLMR